ncbi:hypothetical protein ACFYQA_23685 [Streptomyces sp. NPDC005774]|uniref:hypothetical protein n=1 Tax=Streptomyces sp. NPDC005774 TaxID=3364728 RepID=UPI0036A62D27
MLDLLDIRSGHSVLDAGCGPGTDLPAPTERVGDGGAVIDVDRAPAMPTRARTDGLRQVEIREGDVRTRSPGRARAPVSMVWADRRNTPEARGSPHPGLRLAFPTSRWSIARTASRAGAGW